MAPCIPDGLATNHHNQVEHTHTHTHTHTQRELPLYRHFPDQVSSTGTPLSDHGVLSKLLASEDHCGGPKTGSLRETFARRLSIKIHARSGNGPAHGH